MKSGSELRSCGFLSYSFTVTQPGTKLFLGGHVDTWKFLSSLLNRVLKASLFPGKVLKVHTSWASSHFSRFSSDKMLLMIWTKFWRRETREEVVMQTWPRLGRPQCCGRDMWGLNMLQKPSHDAIPKRFQSIPQVPKDVNGKTGFNKTFFPRPSL